jgi:hypothetical protein
LAWNAAAGSEVSTSVPDGAHPGRSHIADRGSLTQEHARDDERRNERRQIQREYDVLALDDKLARLSPQEERILSAVAHGKTNKMNIAIQVAGSAAVLALVLIPVVHDWVVHRLT